jgi:hypothetical protein
MFAILIFSSALRMRIRLRKHMAAGRRLDMGLPGFGFSGTGGGAVASVAANMVLSYSLFMRNVRRMPRARPEDFAQRMICP